MIELSREILTLIMLGGVLAGVLIGYPLGIVIGGIAFITGILAFGVPITFQIIYARVWDLLNNYILLAVPLFIFMGSMLGNSGITGKMFDALYLWLSGVRGGLALITILIGTILAA